MKYVAFIGSRDMNQFSEERVLLYMDAVRAAVQHGYVVVTGACKGVDQLAAEVALASGGRVLLVLPYPLYERLWVNETQAKFPENVRVEVYNPENHPVWTESVTKYHPAPTQLSEPAIRMHARNYGIVGRAGWVVALPNFEKGGGGTAQGLRIAAGMNKPCWDLRDQKQCVDLMKRLMRAPSAPAQPEALAENSEA